jgi:hypothetical protein
MSYAATPLALRAPNTRTRSTSTSTTRHVPVSTYASSNNLPVATLLEAAIAVVTMSGISLVLCTIAAAAFL